MKTIKDNNTANNSLTLQNKTLKGTGTVHPATGGYNPEMQQERTGPLP